MIGMKLLFGETFAPFLQNKYRLILLRSRYANTQINTNKFKIYEK